MCPGRPRAPSTARFHGFFPRTQSYRGPTEIQKWCSFIHTRCLCGASTAYTSRLSVQRTHRVVIPSISLNIRSQVFGFVAYRILNFFLCFKLPLSLGGKKRTEERRWKGRCSKYRHSPTVVTEQAAILRSASLWPALLGPRLNMTILQKLIQYLCLIKVKFWYNSYYYYYYYYYYLLQLSFHSVAIVLTLVTNKNKYT
jgi:hypothetical protein